MARDSAGRDEPATSTRSSGSDATPTRPRSSGPTASWPGSITLTSTRTPRPRTRFKEITEAYDVLSDPEQRSRYDAFGEDFRRVPPT